MLPSFSTRRFSISSLFFTINPYLETKVMSGIASSLHLRDVFSLFFSYKHEKGTKVPFLLHSQPWAALNAAPREAESVKGVKEEENKAESFHQAKLNVLKQETSIKLRVCIGPLIREFVSGVVLVLINYRIWLCSVS